MAKRKAKPQTTAELRKELRAHINPLVRTVNDHSDEFGRIVDRVNLNAETHNALAGEVANVVERSRIYEPHTDTMVDVAVLRDRVADAFQETHDLRGADIALALRIDARLTDINRLREDFTNHVIGVTVRRELAAQKYLTFGARLRWLLTGK